MVRQNANAKCFGESQLQAEKLQAEKANYTDSVFLDGCKTLQHRLFTASV